MHHAERNYFHLISGYIRNDERFAFFNIIQGNMRYTRIKVFRKAIRHAVLQTSGSIIFRIHRNVTKLTERSQIVQTTHMVIMFMGNQHSVYRTKIIQPKHLFAKIRTAVDKNTYSVYFYQTGTTQTVVTRVGTCTYFTSTSHLRHSRRRSTS